MITPSTASVGQRLVGSTIALPSRKSVARMNSAGTTG